MIYITKQEGLYQNKVNSSLVSTCNCKMDYCQNWDRCPICFKKVGTLDYWDGTFTDDSESTLTPFLLQAFVIPKLS